MAVTSSAYDGDAGPTFEKLVNQQAEGMQQQVAPAGRACDEKRFTYVAVDFDHRAGYLCTL